VQRQLQGENLGINDAVKNWPSARAEDSESAGNHPDATDSLLGATRHWPTAQERDGKGIDQHFQEGALGNSLPNAVHNWATPVGQPANGTAEAFIDRKIKAVANGSQMGLTLSDLQLQASIFPAQNWATPNSTDEKRGTSKNGYSEKQINRPQGCPAILSHDAAEFPSSLPAAAMKTNPTTPISALGLLLQRWTPPSCRALNPNFQWWLMGWPSPGRIFCASGATEWSRWRQASLSALCFLTQSADLNSEASAPAENTS
jgi:hypothetical protein